MRFPLMVVCLLLAVASARAEEEKKETEKKEAPAADKILVVESRPLRIDATLEAVVQAQQASEVAIAPQVWTQLSVLSAVPHGTEVKRGDVLIEFDPAKLDEAIRDLEASRALAEFGIRQATEEIRLLNESVPLEIELAQRVKKLADEDLEQFTKVERPLAEKSAAHSVRTAEQYLEYTLEELRQLEKMYKASDITEETEEIVLKRARNQVEIHQFYVEQQRTQHDLTTRVRLPRTNDELQAAARRQALALEKAQATLPLALNKAKLELERQQFDFSKASESLAKHQADRKLLTVTAPADGVVYYGRLEQGRSVTAADMRVKLRPGGAVAPREVMVTIVSPKKVVAAVTIDEKDLHGLQAGQSVRIRPASSPQTVLTGKLEEWSLAPTTEGKFSGRVTFDKPPTLLPGMRAEVKAEIHRSEAAIVVPESAVVEDELDEAKHYVYLVREGKEPARQPVKIGMKHAKQVEIVSGLKAGDRILKAKPE